MRGRSPGRQTHHHSQHQVPVDEVVAVVKDLGARSLHRQHEFHVSSHRMGAEFDVLLGIAVAKFVRMARLIPSG